MYDFGHEHNTTHKHLVNEVKHKLQFKHQQITLEFQKHPV